MKKFAILLTAVLMMLVFVSCSQNIEDGEAVISFSVDGRNTRSLESVGPVFDTDSLYWYYTAEKTDTIGITEGAAAEQKAVNEGKKGLASVGPFAYGEWTFTLYGYTTYDTSNKSCSNLAYKSEATSVSISSSTTSIPMTVSAAITADGKGTLEIPVSGGSITLIENGNTVDTANSSYILHVDIKGLGSLAAYSSEGDIPGTVTGSAKWNLSSGSYAVTLTYKKDCSSSFDSGKTIYSGGTAVGTGTIYVTICDNLTTGLRGTIEGTSGYTVTFNLNGGTIGGSSDNVVQTVDAGGTATRPETDPTKTRMVLNFWSEDGTSEFDFSTQIYGNITLTAVWRDYVVGDVGPGGGHIFYDAGSVQTSYYMDGSTQKSYTWRFLEAAPADAATSNAIFGYYRPSSTGSNTAVQSNLDTSITIADHTTYNGNAAVGQGRMNTSLLVNAMETAAYTSSSGTDTTNTYAAKLCVYYSFNGYSDWFLPSIEELRYMYENLKSKSIGTWSTSYWSSSEYSATRVWSYSFDNALAANGGRNSSSYVRAVRAF